VTSENNANDPAAAETRPGLSRRALLLGAAGGGLAVGAAAGAGGMAIAGAVHAADEETIDLTRSFPFYDQAHQPGIQTPQQRYTVFMTFDLASDVRQDLQVLLARWSGAIAQLMAGRTVGAVQPDRADAVAPDTGEALDLAPGGLTVTVGLGPGVFDRRFGLAPKKPRHLDPLPDLPSDRLQAGLSGGDLSVQACADDPQVAYHAIRDLARMAQPTASTRWTVLGFGRASAGAGQKTPRNLMGFKDGTRNLKDDADFDRFVWVGDDTAWTRGGSYQVVRKIQMHIENWDADTIGDQQLIFGRGKAEGEPLTGRTEFDTPDFHRKHTDGRPVISDTSHIALAAHENNDGVKILRRGYNYTDGINQYGVLDAGLLFISYQKDPEQFIRLQRKLGSSDLLNEYIAHIGSGLFFVPPAPRRGSYLAEKLF
jgi:deferrochelatase/peroxidase EfeB